MNVGRSWFLLERGPVMDDRVLKLAFLSQRFGQANIGRYIVRRAGESSLVEHDRFVLLAFLPKRVGQSSVGFCISRSLHRGLPQILDAGIDFISVQKNFAEIE